MCLLETNVHDKARIPVSPRALGRGHRNALRSVPPNFIVSANRTRSVILRTSSSYLSADGMYASRNTLAFSPIYQRLLRRRRRRSIRHQCRHLPGAGPIHACRRRRTWHLRRRLSERSPQAKRESRYVLVAPSPLKKPNLESGPSSRSGTCPKNRCSSE